MIYIGPDRYENIDINKSFKIFEKKSDKPAKFPKEERFFEIRDKFTNHELFKTGNNLHLKKTKKNELILEDIWYESFDQ